MHWILRQLSTCLPITKFEKYTVKLVFCSQGIFREQFLILLGVQLFILGGNSMYGTSNSEDLLQQ